MPVVVEVQLSAEEQVDLALHYWEQNLKPGMVAYGTPEDALTALRSNYVKDVQENPEALKQLIEHYQA